jgi:N-acetyl-1-D-myo-inositol-2-amino-2-deoxy-alpha-D-glucopyranoside deacetylase
MTVHAHPDDETIGTGGTMALNVAAGRRVVLVTCTRGEQGEIVVPALDTPENHRRLGEIRMGELERALDRLGVTEWENLGYRDSDMMGRPANHDPRCFWQADLDDAARRLTWCIRRYQPDVVTTYNAFGGYGHPDHIRTHDVTLLAVPRAGDPTWYLEQLRPEFGGTGPATEQDGGLAPWSPAKLYEQAIPASVRQARRDRMTEIDGEDPWAPPPDATPEQLAAFEATVARMLTPDESITAWIDLDDDALQRKWEALREHVTQIRADSWFVKVGLEGWREIWNQETFVLTHSTVDPSGREADRFEGLE